tara:strand:+ start:186 stop:1343 length:1158 start_codon:yes stop_codon:yes gene_type:complete
LISILKKIYNKLSKLINAKKIWKLPNKNDLLILDETGLDKIKATIIGRTPCTILHTRNEYIYIPIFFFSIIYFFKYNFKAYKICFIKYVNPKVILTFVDTLINFSNTIYDLKHLKYMMIMNGRRHSHEIKILDTKKKYKLDYYFVFGDYYKKFVEDKLICQAVSTGSIIANSIEKPVFQNIEKIQFISSWTPGHLDKFYGKNVEKEFSIATKFILNVIKKFRDKKNLPSEILLRTNYNEEIEFYKKMNNDFKFIKKDNQNFINSYKNLSEKAMIVGQDSTFLMESFSLGYRTAFFTFNDKSLDNFHPDFMRFYPWFWPSKLHEEGFFWCNIRSDEKILKVLDNLFTVDAFTWKKKIAPYQKGVMHRNPDNLIIKEILKKEGIKFR